MNNSAGQNSLDEVLDAYLEASDGPDRKLLAEWIARYPQFERELIEFTVAWIQSEKLPEVPGDPQDKTAMLQAGLKIAQRAYEKMIAENQVPKSSSHSELVSLILEGSRFGWTPDQFAQRMNVSLEILRKFEQKMIIAATIPTRLIEDIGDAIQRDPADIVAYLQQPATMQADLRHKSRRSPRIGNPQNFFEAVRSDAELSDEQRAYWLSFQEGTS